MSIYKAGAGWGDDADYPTPALCVTDRAGVDTDDIIILLKGYLGRNNVITGFHPFNILIYSDGVLYDGSNSDDLAWFSGVSVSTTSPLVLRDFSSNNDGNGYDTPLLLGANALNATIENFHSIRTKLVASYPTVRIDSQSLTNSVRRGVVDANHNGKGLDHKYDDKTNLSGITALNSLSKGLAGTNKASCSDSLSVNNIGDDFAAFLSTTNCGSEDLTGNGTGYSLADMIDPANKNYQVKTTSTAHALNIGAFFQASNTTENYSFLATISINPELSALKSKISNYSVGLSQLTLINGSFVKKSNVSGVITQAYQQYAMQLKKSVLKAEIAQSYQQSSIHLKKVAINGELQQSYAMQGYFSNATTGIHQFTATISITPLNSANFSKKSIYQHQNNQVIELSGQAIKCAALQTNYQQEQSLVSNTAKRTNIAGEIQQSVLISALFFNSAQPIYLHQFRINGEIAFQRFNGATVKQRFNGVLC